MKKLKSKTTWVQYTLVSGLLHEITAVENEYEYIYSLLIKELYES